MTQTKTKDESVVEPIEDVEEVNPLDLIASLERDNAIQQAALRKIIRMSPSGFAGGPNNKSFGRGYEKAFQEAQKTALGAFERLENQNGNSDD